VRIFDLVRDARLEEARALWSRLTEFVRLEFGPFPAELPSAHIIAVVKAALNALGDAVGDPLPPIQPLRGADLEVVRRVVQSLAKLERSMSAEQQTQP
jgi:dihydrodipicolinate synthase/N-acetylneuraminate lyase